MMAGSTGKRLASSVSPASWARAFFRSRMPRKIRMALSTITAMPYTFGMKSEVMIPGRPELYCLIWVAMA